MACMIYRPFRKILPRFYQHRFSSLVEKYSGTGLMRSYCCIKLLGSSTPFRHLTLLSMPYDRLIGRARVSWLLFGYLPLTIVTITKFLRWFKRTSRSIMRIYNMHNNSALVNTHRYNHFQRSTSRTIIHRSRKLRITCSECRLRTRVPQPHRELRRIMCLRLDTTPLQILPCSLLGILRRKPLQFPPMSRI